MQYFDKNGKEIKAGMKILMEDGKVELVYDTEDAYGNPNLGINASNEDFLRAHPNWVTTMLKKCSLNWLKEWLFKKVFPNNSKRIIKSSGLA